MSNLFPGVFIRIQPLHKHISVDVKIVKRNSRPITAANVAVGQIR